MPNLHVMRTYLVRYREYVSADEESEALEKHRGAFEKRICALPSGEVEVLDEETEADQLDDAGSGVDRLNIVRDVVIDWQYDDKN